MSKPHILNDKWGKESLTPTVEHFHSAIRALAAERLTASGKAWEDVVHDPAMELTAEDFQAVEQSLLSTGYTFDTSAHVSLVESPEKYKPLAVVSDSGNQATDDEGRKVVGTGDNVFSAPDMSGTARFVSTVDAVMQMLIDGVPPNTIAIIDDSGGTLTAPILEGFAGVICMGGTIRSHLGILTREYNIPCLMAAELDGLADGDEIHVEYSKHATDAYAERDDTNRVRISKIS